MNRLHTVVRSRSKMRRNDPKQPKHKVHAARMVILTIISLFTAGLIFLGVLLYSQVSQNLPSIIVLENLLRYPGGLLHEPTRFYDRTGEIVIHTLENPYVQETQYHTIQDGKSSTLPDELLMATIATLDPNFWEHAGVDFFSMCENPTIAEILVDELIMWDQPDNQLNPWKTRLLALQITDTYGHDQILEWYLNSVNMGTYLMGIDEASQVYLGKSPADINLAEAALLAAVMEAPALNPIDSPLAALDRQQLVLRKMVQFGYISEEEALAANEDPIHIVHNEVRMDPLVEAFTVRAANQIEPAIPYSRLVRGGYQVITTIDYQIQTDTQCMMVIHLTRLELQQPDYSVIKDCPTSGLLPRLSEDDIPNDGSLAAEAVVYDPESAEVLAYVKMNDDNRQPQPGTIISPFLYLTAFTRGMNPASLVWDLPLETLGGVPQDFLGPVSARSALANDLISPLFSLYKQVGVENALKTYQTIGLHSIELSQQTDISIELQNGTADIIETAQGYGTLANEGILAGIEVSAKDGRQQKVFQPVYVLSVKEYDHRIIYTQPQKTIRPVTTRQLSYLISDILSDVYTHRAGASNAAYLEIGRPAAVKTATTTSGKDVWTVGYTPDLVTAVWVGETDLEKTERIRPVLSSSIWRAVTQNALEDHAYQVFEQPDGISVVEVCSPSGGLPTSACPSVVKEKFLTGQEPTQFDTLYQPLEINSRTGKLATLFTPVEQIVEEVYIILPPEAQEWANAAGIKVPPEDYDSVMTSMILNDETGITSPGMFDYIGGVVEIRGTADSAEFQYYRLQAGQGLNPREWFQLSDSKTEAVEDGLLGTWDTSEFNGLFAVQLLIVDQENRVQTATVHATIDNVSPDLTIFYPQDGQTFSAAQGSDITFQADAEDNIGIDRVEFMVDDSLVFQMQQAPFLFPWDGAIGDHLLTIRVYDLAGNMTEQIIQFSIVE